MKIMRELNEKVRYSDDATDAIRILSNWVRREGWLLHGSVTSGIEVLEPKQEKNLSTTRDGDRVRSPPSIFATTFPEVALFYALVQGPAKAAGLYREVGAGVREVCDDTDGLPAWLFYAADQAKDIVRRREETGEVSTIYSIERKHFKSMEAKYEWSATSPVEVCARLVVSSACFPLKVAELSAPSDDPFVRDLFDKHPVTASTS